MEARMKRLIWAALKGYHEYVEALLQHPDIDIYLQNNYGWTAAGLADYYDFDDVASLIWSYC